MSSDNNNQYQKIDETRPVVWTPEDASRFLTSAIHEAQKPLADALRQRPVTSRALTLIIAVLVVAAFAIALILSSQLEKTEKRADAMQASREEMLSEKVTLQAQASSLEEKLGAAASQGATLREQVDSFRVTEEKHQRTRQDLARMRRQNELLRDQISGLEMEKTALARQLEAVRALAETDAEIEMDAEAEPASVPESAPPAPEPEPVTVPVPAPEPETEAADANPGAAEAAVESVPEVAVPVEPVEVKAEVEPTPEPAVSEATAPEPVIEPVPTIEPESIAEPESEPVTPITPPEEPVEIEAGKIEEPAEEPVAESMEPEPVIESPVPSNESSEPAADEATAEIAEETNGKTTETPVQTPAP